MFYNVTTGESEDHPSWELIDNDDYGRACNPKGPGWKIVKILEHYTMHEEKYEQW